MLQLILDRKWKLDDYSIGNLYVNDVLFCNTLEDTDRKLNDGMDEEQIAKIKIYSNTAIPTGTYKIAMDIVSPTFKNRVWAKPYDGKIPRLLDVKGFKGVLIHPGNTAKDTLGCILVGENKVKGQVVKSQITFHKLMKEYLLPAYNRGEEIFITIKN